QVVEVVEPAAEKALGTLAFLGIPRTEQDVAKDLVPTLVGGDGPAQVFDEIGLAGVLALHDVVQDATHVQRVFRTVDKPANGLPALVGRSFLREGNGLARRGNAAGQVERDAAQELCVIRWCCGRGVSRLPVFREPAVYALRQGQCALQAVFRLRPVVRARRYSNAGQAADEECTQAQAAAWVGIRHGTGSSAGDEGGRQTTGR